MAAQAVLAGGVGYGAAVHDELRRGIGIAALGEVHHLGAVGLDQSDVGVIPAADADVVGQEPAAVGTPLEAHVAVGVAVVVLAVEGCGHFLAL